METIGHHTCLNKGGQKYVYDNAPFLAEYYDEDKNKPYLVLPVSGISYFFIFRALECNRDDYVT